jgi:hypothetical protein
MVPFAAAADDVTEVVLPFNDDGDDDDDDDDVDAPPTVVVSDCARAQNVSPFNFRSESLSLSRRRHLLQMTHAATIASRTTTNTDASTAARITTVVDGYLPATAAWKTTAAPTRTDHQW